MRSRRIAPLSLALALAACSGGGGGGSAVTPSYGGAGSGSSAPQSVQLNVHIPGGGSTSSTSRRPQYVAATTAGVLIQVYASSDTMHTNLLAASATNVSAGSSACGGASGARTCTVSIPAPPGTDDFVFTTYDQVPNGPASFASNANVLATGVVHGKPIVVAQANVVNVVLSGAIGSLLLQPSPDESLLAGPNGTANPGTYSLEVTALDVDGNVIIAGSGDPYNVPITVTATEAAGTCVPIVAADCTSGATGHTSITLGGPAGTGSSSVQVTQSGQIVTVKFDGRGDPSYHVTFQASATGAATVSSSFTPMYVDSTSVPPAFTPGIPVSVSITSGQTITVNLREYAATSFTVNQGACAGIASASAPAPSGAAELSTITGGATGGACTLTYSDGLTSWNVNVTNSATTANVVVPGQTLAFVPLGAAGISITTTSGVQVGSVATASSADVAGLDDSGNLFVGTAPPGGDVNGTGPGSISLYTPSGTSYPPAYTKSSATYTLTNPNHLAFLMVSGAGELVAVEFGGSTETYDEWDPGHTGAPSRTFTRSPYNGQLFLSLFVAHNGNVYVGEFAGCGPNTCVQFDVIPPGTTTPSRTIVESLVPQANQINFGPNYIAVGPDGTLYITEYTFGLPDPLAGLYIYPPSGPERYVANGAEYPQGIDIDAAGNLYIVNNSTAYNTGSASPDTAHNVAVLSPDGGTVLRRISGSLLDAYPIAVAPDGTAFVSAFAIASLGVPGATWVAAPGASSVTTIAPASTDVVFWNGTAETTSRVRRSALGGSTGSAHASGFAMHRR